MKEQLKVELQELTNLETAGTLEDSQKSRLEELKEFEQVEQTAEQTKKDLNSALAQKDHFRTKSEKEEADRKVLEAKLNEVTGNTKKLREVLDVEEYIGISTSLEGLDQAEKTFLAEQHKLTGKPLNEIRNSEDFALWDSGHKAKVEKEKSLKPSNTQSDSEVPKTLADKLANASLAEKEKILTEAGLYKSPHPHRVDRTNIGQRI